MTNQEDRFDDACDDATHAVIATFEWLPGLPEGADLSALMYRINDAITAIMGDFK
jgi:hypothetical protein